MSNRSLQLIGIALILIAIWLSGCKPTPFSTNALVGAGISQIPIPGTINNVFGLSLSPSNSKLAFMGQIGDFNANVYILDLATGVITMTLPPHAYYPISWPKWSPDGTRISFSGFNLHQSNAGVWISYGVSNTESVASGIGAAWSPSGSRLAVISSVDDKYEIRIVDLATNKSESIYTVYRVNSQDVLSDLDWSPDDSALAFIVTEKKDGGSVSHLYRIGIDGNNVQSLMLVPDGQFLSDPKWVLGGKWIAFLTGSGLSYKLDFVRSDGKCISSPLKGLNDIMEMDISRDGTLAVVRIGTNLYKVDLKAILVAGSLETTLVCP